MSLYVDCIEAGLTIDHHESDLYIKDCPAARKLLEKYDPKVTAFYTEDINEPWWDVQFAYDPFWEKKTIKP